MNPPERQRGPLYWGVTALVWLVLIVITFFVALVACTTMLGEGA